MYPYSFISLCLAVITIPLCRTPPNVDVHVDVERV